jgi:hypothetical protein
LGTQISTYERTWRDASGANEVQDLVVRFSKTAAALAFVRAVRRSLDAGDIESSGPLRSVPGAQRVTYLATTAQAGIGQAVTLRAGVYVGVLTFFSGASGNPAPITAVAAERVARAQDAALRAAPGGTAVAPAPRPGTSFGGTTWAVLAVVVLGAAVATPLFLRRRRRPGSGRGPV